MTRLKQAGQIILALACVFAAFALPSMWTGGTGL